MLTVNYLPVVLVEVFLNERHKSQTLQFRYYSILSELKF